MYETPDDDERLGCRETWALLRAVFAVLIPALLVIIFIAVAVSVAFLLFALHPALALAPVALLAVAGMVFLRWEQRRFRPPDA